MPKAALRGVTVKATRFQSGSGSGVTGLPLPSRLSPPRVASRKAHSVRSEAKEEMPVKSAFWLLATSWPTSWTVPSSVVESVTPLKTLPEPPAESHGFVVREVGPLTGVPPVAAAASQTPPSAAPQGRMRT